MRKRSVGLRRVEREESAGLGLGLPSWPWPSRVPVLGAVQLFLCCADSDETRNIEKISGKPKGKGKIPLGHSLSCLHPLRSSSLVISLARARVSLPQWRPDAKLPGPRLRGPSPVGPCSLPVQAPPVASVPVSRARSSAGGIHLALTPSARRPQRARYASLSYTVHGSVVLIFFYGLTCAVYLHTYSTCPLTDLYTCRLLRAYCSRRRTTRRRRARRGWAARATVASGR